MSHLHRPHDDLPGIAELAERLRGESRGLSSWVVFENESFAQVFEFAAHRRMQVWEETDEVGNVDGYSWQEQLWAGSEWVNVSTVDGVAPLNEEQLRGHRSAFQGEAEATHPGVLSTREAALDRMMRVALGTAASLARKVDQLERQLNTTAEDLRRSEADNDRILTALNLLTQRPPRARRPASPEQTAPVAGSPAVFGKGPSR